MASCQRSAAGHGPATGAATSTPVIAWRTHPLVEEPARRTILLAGAILGFGVVAGMTLVSPVLGGVSVVVLTVSVSRYWAPTQVQLDAAGVHIRHLGRVRNRPWSDFGRLSMHGDGIFLGPFRRPSRLDAFRGVFLRCNDELEAVRRVAEYYVEMEPGQRVVRPRLRSRGTEFSACRQ